MAVKNADGTVTVTGDYGLSITISNGVAIGNPVQINQLRVAYSKAVLDVAARQAKAKGWNVKKVGNKLEVFK